MANAFQKCGNPFLSRPGGHRVGQRPLCLWVWTDKRSAINPNTGPRASKGRVAEVSSLIAWPVA